MVGRLFVKGEGDETFYDNTVRKFGIEEVFQLIEECAPRMRNGLFHSLW